MLKYVIVLAVFGLLLMFTQGAVAKNEQPSKQELEEEYFSIHSWAMWSERAGHCGPLKGAEVLPMISVPWLKKRWRPIHEDGMEYQGS